MYTDDEIAVDGRAFFGGGPGEVREGERWEENHLGNRFWGHRLQSEGRFF